MEIPAYASAPVSSSTPLQIQLPDAVGQAVMVTDLAGTIIYWNRAAELLYGSRADEAVGRKLFEMVPTNETREQASEIMDLLRAGRSWTGEAELARRAGSRTTVHVTHSPIIDADANLVGIVGVSTDIGAQKRMLGELESEKSQLQVVFENAPAFMCLLRGPDHVFEVVNRAYGAHAGRESRLIVGMTVAAALPELVGQGYIELLDRVYRTGEPFIGSEMPIKLRRQPDQTEETRYVDFISQPLRDDAGQISGVLVHGVDVTDHMRAREAVCRASRENQLIMDRSLDVICTADAEGRFVQVSSASQRVLGYAPTELRGRSFLQLVHPSDAVRTARVFTSMMEGKDVTDFENRFVRKDGSVVHLMWSFTWSREDELVFAVARDVTEARARERELAARGEALRRSEQRFRSLVYATAQVVWTADLEGNKTELSDAWTELTGRPLPSTSGEDWIGLIHPDDHARVQRAWSEHASRRTAFDLEYRISTAAGNYRWLSSRHVPVFDDSGKFVEWVGTCTDIDARKCAEAALLKSEARYRTIIDTASEGVWLVDADARSTFANARMAEILGYSAEELQGRPFLDFIHEEDRAQTRERFHNRRLGVSETYDVRLSRRDGSIRWALISASPFYDEKGAFAGSLGMVTDITERKRAEEALHRAKEKAEQMARLKSSFLTNMSHEIRTPLTSIIGYSDLISQEASGDLKSLAESIRKGGERLMLTLDSVLALAQLESGSLRLRFHPIDVVQQVQDVLPLFDRLAREKGLCLTFESVVPRLMTRLDRGALSRILTNLLDNAIKFTCRGGVAVRLSGSADAVRIQISDTGIGIGTEFRWQLFEEFRQESDGLSRAYEGVGLGLAITRRLVTLMGGTIEVDSTEGVGSSFTICLPSDRVQQKSGDTTDTTLLAS